MGLIPILQKWDLFLYCKRLFICNTLRITRQNLWVIFVIHFEPLILGLVILKIIPGKWLEKTDNDAI